MAFDAGLELYLSMLRVKNGSPPEVEARSFMERAPARLSISSKSCMRRAEVLALWTSGCTTDEIVQKTGLNSAHIYRTIKKLRARATFMRGLPTE